MKHAEPDRLQKVVFLAVNALGWLGLVIRLVRYWHAMPSDAHFWGIAVVVMFPALWRDLLREKNSFLSLITATLTFLAVLGIAFRAL